MSRVTPADVKEIVTTSLTDGVIQVWIDGAHSIVNNAADCIGGDEALLTQVELYLSAHFVAMLSPDGRGFVTKENVDTFETTYSNPVVLSRIIDQTPYGQTANMLSNGCLASLGDKKATVEFFLVPAYYARLAGIASRAINRYGSAGEFVKKGTTGGFDADMNPLPNESDTVITGIVTPLAQYKAHEIDGTSIIAGDSRVTFQGDGEPTVNMQITINSKTYRAISVYKLASNAGEVIYYTVQLRHG